MATSPPTIDTGPTVDVPRSNAWVVFALTFGLLTFPLSRNYEEMFIARLLVGVGEAATDAGRITALEAQLKQQKVLMEQQQRMLESLEAELKRLKAREGIQVGQ